ncbi:MAG TPA: hypothetical protein VKB33_09530 [Nitrospira sp.]|nr:hypothetical protein [Nitrospira sp.]
MRQKPKNHATDQPYASPSTIIHTPIATKSVDTISVNSLIRSIVIRLWTRGKEFSISCGDSPEELDEILGGSAHDVVVARVAHANFVDEPPKVGDAEERFKITGYISSSNFSLSEESESSVAL